MTTSGLVDDHASGEAHQDWREGRQRRTIRSVPDGRGCGLPPDVQSNSEEHRETEASTRMDMIRHATAAFLPGATRWGGHALEGLVRTRFRLVRALRRRGREK